jgi:hypothetical protein
MYCMYQGIQCKLSNYCFRMLQNIGYHICLVYWSLIRRVQLVDQELLTLPEHLSPSRAFSGVRVTPSLLLCVCFVDRCLSFCLFFQKKKNRQHNDQKKKNRQHNGQKKKNRQHNGQKKKDKTTNHASLRTVVSVN